MDIDILPDEIIREIISWINYITPLTRHLLPTLNKRWAKLALSLCIPISNYKQYRHAIKRGDYLSLISSSFRGPDHNEWRSLLVKQACKSGWLGIASALVHKYVIERLLRSLYEFRNGAVVDVMATKREDRTIIII